MLLAGMAEIRSAHEALAATPRFRKPADAAWLLPLHSSVAGDQQRRVFADPPAGVRKVVLATNIAGVRSARLDKTLNHPAVICSVLLAASIGAHQ